jgi:hypothetical protein
MMTVVLIMMMVVLMIILWTDGIVSGGMPTEHAPIRIVQEPATATTEQLRRRFEMIPKEVSTMMMVMMFEGRGGNKRMVQTLWTVKMSRKLNFGLWVWLAEITKVKSFSDHSVFKSLSGHPAIKGKITSKRKWRVAIVEIIEVEIMKRENVPFWIIVLTSVLVPSHMGRQFVEYSSSPFLSSCFCLLHTIRYLNHEIFVRQVRVFSSDLRHGFVSRFLHRLLVDLLNIVVKSASALDRIAEMIVVCNILRAYIATKDQSVTHRAGPPLTIACWSNSGISSCCSRAPL